MMYPDYDRSILSTTASVLNYYGVKGVYPTLPELDKALSDKPKHVMLIIIDGTGSNLIDRYLPDMSYLASHRMAKVTSVYPSTTTAATTSYYNGMSAYEHGWLGWQLFFKEYATDVVTFMKSTYYTRKTVDGPHPASTVMPYETVFERIKASRPDVALRTLYAFDSYCEKGADERLRISSFPEICKTLSRISKNDEESYTIAYWGEPDTSMHAYGVGSKEANAQFEMIDRELPKLSKQLSDTLLIVTADHGLVNSKGINLEEMPEIMDCLTMPPSIETRCAAFFVKPYRKNAFEKLFNERFGKDFVLFSREDVYRLGLFGRGKRNDKFDDFIGDYIACATGEYDIEYTPLGTKNTNPIGKHAGLTEDEMLVPVIIDRIK